MKNVQKMEAMPGPGPELSKCPQVSSSVSKDHSILLLKKSTDRVRISEDMIDNAFEAALCEICLDQDPQPERPQPWWKRCLRQEWDDVTSAAMWKACLAELVGVFFLCFHTIGMGVAAKNLLQAALGTGLFVYVIISALFHVSGAHINPAVTVGVASLRKVTCVRAVFYIIFQCAGAVLGSLAIEALLPSDHDGNLGVIVPPKASSTEQVVVMEAIITGFLTFVILAALDSGRTDVIGPPALVFGLTITANILLAADISGGCMNPARALGPAVVRGDYYKLWVYWVGPLAGGLVGCWLYDKLFRVGASLPGLVLCEPDHNSDVTDRRDDMELV